VAAHPSCMGWWFNLDVCQDAKYHETSSIKALVHHIVGSLSEASNIAFLDLQLLIGMHELLLEDDAHSFVYKICNNFL
jgi:hypothetical protein